MANRLAKESSPYLQQHQENPVDWYPWGEEAFAAARAADKPVFVSIGYAACHWCHVMAHESFESEEIAALMNELFINVKVDREERPDVDAVYMNAIHVMGEGGGWPLSAFCDPEGRPYYLGTYFPPVDRYGRPGFPTVLRTMAKVYAEQRDKVEQNALAVLDGLRHLDEHQRRAARNASGDAPGRDLLIAAGRALVQRSDPQRGGFGQKPKFPSSSAHELLGRCARLPFGGPARDAFLLQAKEMARGGIYDHLGGGFARYSVDERWLVPHFEKMLYDNAQLLGIYGDAYAMTGERDYQRVVEETVAWLSREMLDDSGGLYASLDADSEGQEGKFYVWTPEEIEDVLGAVRSMLFSGAYGVTAHGNFEDGTTVLSRVTERGADSDEAALADMRAELLAAREARVRPATDTKILAGWNGLAVSGLVRAWEATGHQPALELARRVGTFLAERLVDGERLWRVFKDGERKLDGTVDDYAFVAHAFLRLAEATGEPMWWQRGATLAGAVLERFYQEEDGVGVFYMTASDAGDPLVHRPESHTDGAIPSGAAVAVECLVRLWRIGGDERARDVAERYLAGRAPQAAEQPFMAARLLCALDELLHGSEVVVTDGAGRDELVAALRRAHAPGAALAGPWAHPDVLAGKQPGDGGRARAYVCRGQTCSAPVSDPGALVELLAPAS